WVRRPVQVVERRCAEAFRIGQDHIVIGIEVISHCTIEGVFATELFVLVVTQAELGRKNFTLPAVLDEQRLIPALVFIVLSVAIERINVPVNTEQQTLTAV